MAPKYSFISLFFATFLLACLVLVQARDIPPFGDIALTREPKENYFILKKKPAVIMCEARNAETIQFTCAGSQIHSKKVVTESSDSLLRAQIKISRSEVFKHSKKQKGPFWCECSALDFNGQPVMTSERATISIAYLKHKFKAQPKSQTVSEGENVEIECGVPKGKPAPEVLWRKDRRRLNLDNDPRLVVTEQGTLVIESVESKDAGTYSCVAKNPAGRKESQGAKLTVSVFAESSEPIEEVSNLDANGQIRRTARQSPKKPIFELEPHPRYQIRRGEQLEIECKVIAANIMTFRCNDQRMPKTQVDENSNRNNEGIQVLQHRLTLTYSDVSDYYRRYQNNPPYSCVCVAWFQKDGKWTSVKTSDDLGAVELVYLEETFKREPSDLTVGVNTDATLLCEPPKGSPDPWVNWYKDGAPLDPRTNDHYTVNNRGHLTIHNVAEEDRGVYTCEAENIGGKVQSQRARLLVTGVVRRTRPTRPTQPTRPTRPRPVVTDPPTPPPPTAATKTMDAVPTFPDVIPETAMFLTDLEEKYMVAPGESVTLTCTMISLDQASLTCGQERILINDDNSKKFRDEASGKTIIQAFHEVTAEEVTNSGGNFFCQCTAWYVNDDRQWENRAGKLGYIVVAEPEKHIPKEYIEDEFTSYPTSLTVEVDQSAEFICEAPQGNPKPMVFWLKDGARINPNDNYYVYDSGRLTIGYVSTVDQGDFICVAENAAGRRMTPAVRLTVIVPTVPTVPTPEPTVPTPEPTDDLVTDDDYYVTRDYDNYDYETTEMKLTSPLFTQQIEEKVYLFNDAKSMSLGHDGEDMMCIVVGEIVKNVVIMCNNAVVTETTQTARHMIEPTYKKKVTDNKIRITYDKVEAWTAENEGNFNCWCRAYYKAEGSEELLSADADSTTFELGYFEKEFALEPEDMEVSKGEMATLQCLPPNAAPIPTLSWLKDGFNLKSDDRRMITTEGNLIIKDFTDEDVGMYTCVAENEYDRRTSRLATVSLAGSTMTQTMTQGCDTMAMKCSEMVPDSENPSAKAICKTITSKIKCFEDVIVACPDQKAIIEPMVNQMKSQFASMASMCDTGSTMTQGCDTMAMKCSEMVQNSANSANPSASVMCKTMHTAIKCFEDLIVACPDQKAMIEPALNPLKAQFASMASICDTAVEEEVIVSEKSSDVEGSNTQDVDAEPSPEPDVEPSPHDGVRFAHWDEPFISKDLQDTYYMIKKNPVTIMCEAHNVMHISFSCNNNPIGQAAVTSSTTYMTVEGADGQENEIPVTKAEITVTKEDLDNSGGEYMCQCFAYYMKPGMEDEYKKSGEGWVEEAYLKKKFGRTPGDVVVTVGQDLSLSCQPPMGNPEPKVYLEKDGKRTDLYSPLYMDYFEQVELEDRGYYKCVAENVAATRQSTEFYLTVNEAATGAGVVDQPDNEGKHGETNNEIDTEVVVPTGISLEGDEVEKGEMEGGNTKEQPDGGAETVTEPIGAEQSDDHDLFEGGEREENEIIINEVNETEVTPTETTNIEDSWIVDESDFGNEEPYKNEEDNSLDKMCMRAPSACSVWYPKDTDPSVRCQENKMKKYNDCVDHAIEQCRGKLQPTLLQVMAATKISKEKCLNPKLGGEGLDYDTVTDTNMEGMDQTEETLEVTEPSSEEIDDGEAAAGASMDKPQNPPGGGASSVSMSFLLATVTQLILAILLSWR